MDNGIMKNEIMKKYEEENFESYDEVSSHFYNEKTKKLDFS